MPQRRPRISRAPKKIDGSLPIVNPNAAGIDAGSEEHWVSVREDRDEQPVRVFGTFTEDLHALADWLVACQVTTVAIEATGVYWIPIYEILEARGLNPRLIDGRQLGRRRKKTDVVDCQRIRQRHSYGMLDAAFRPSDEILPLRAYARQRRMLIEYSSDHIRHMQKALDLMNLKLHLVISDITGVTGLRIIRAILNGTRDPQQLAAMREPGCANSEETIAKALTGNYREEHLFALDQAHGLFQEYQTRVAHCDAKIAQALACFEKKAEASELPQTKRPRRRKNQPHIDARSMLFEMVGVDLTAIDGFEASSLLTIVSETGTDMSPWPTGGHFASWLTLCPNKAISGGRQLYRKQHQATANRATQAFRLAAQTLERSNSALGAFFRRIRSRHGRKTAICATAHKLALIFYSIMKSRKPYQDPGATYYEERYRQRLLNSLETKASILGFKLVPAEGVH